MERRSFLKYVVSFFVGAGVGEAVGYQMYHPKYEHFRDKYLTLWKASSGFAEKALPRQRLGRLLTEMMYALVKGKKERLSQLSEAVKSEVEHAEDPELFSLWDEVEGSMQQGEALEKLVEMLLINQYEVEEMLIEFQVELKP
ncbi:MAG: hypothetical protein DRO43_06245 [Candidatus Hecatellales archaeon]|nr:MAG: hypothetical protein DRO43_06245 [Candidatus Hecatellales archaeon]